MVIFTKEGLNVNKEMVRSLGWAVAYKKYVWWYEFMNVLEKDSQKKAKFGLLERPKPIAPWDFSINNFI